MKRKLVRQNVIWPPWFSKNNVEDDLLHKTPRYVPRNGTFIHKPRCIWCVINGNDDNLRITLHSLFLIWLHIALQSCGDHQALIHRLGLRFVGRLIRPVEWHFKWDIRDSFRLKLLVRKKRWWYVCMKMWNFEWEIMTLRHVRLFSFKRK